MSDENDVFQKEENPVVMDSNNRSQKGEGIGLGIASMVLGIISIILSCTYINVITAIVSIILGIIQIVKNEKKGMAIAGIVCSVVSVVILVMLVIIGIAVMNTSAYQEIIQNMQ
ncbi:MAG: DUF4190 domain-containing protein [Lachnospiraceae bacterium]